MDVKILDYPCPRWRNNEISPKVQRINVRNINNIEYIMNGYFNFHINETVYDGEITIVRKDEKQWIFEVQNHGILLTSSLAKFIGCMEIFPESAIEGVIIYHNKGIWIVDYYPLHIEDSEMIKQEIILVQQNLTLKNIAIRGAWCKECPIQALCRLNRIEERR